MSQVLTDIKPYITKKFMAAPCVKEQDILVICQILLPRYKNVQLMQGLTNNKPDFRIQIKGLFGTEEKRFEVVGGDKKRSATKKKSDMGWIDRLEEIDAALDDFLYQCSAESYLRQNTLKTAGKRWSDTTRIIYMDTPAVRHGAEIPLA